MVVIYGPNHCCQEKKCHSIKEKHIYPFTSFAQRCALCPFRGIASAPCKGLVGETRQRDFAGTNFKPHKLPENAPTPTCRVHLGMMMGHHFPPKNVHLSKEDIPKGAVFEEIDAFLPIPG
jgi:hypothetical protein